MPDTNTPTNDQTTKIISLDNLETYTGYVERKGIDITYAEYQQLTPEEKQGKTYYITDYDYGASADASDIIYDNTESGLESTNVQDGIDELNSNLESSIQELQANFQDGVDDIYDAVVAKGTTPASKSLSDVVQGIADIETATVHTETYTASSRASNLDMGESHEYRYVNTNSVPNTNASTYSVDSNGIKDMGDTNSYRYVNVNVPHPTHTTTYKPTSRASNNDMGATHSYRYVDTTAVPNSNSGTYTGATSNGLKDMGATHSYRYVNVQVPNSNSGTYGSVTSNGVKDMGATNSYRYVNVQVPHPTHTTTYTPTSRASNNDMGATHSYRYVNTNSVPNTNSGTYTYGSGSTGGTADMGATNTYRYVNASNVYAKGKADGATVHSGTYTFPANDTGGTKDLGTSHTYRYVNADNVYNKGKADGGAGKRTISVATVIESTTTWDDNTQRASKVTFSATNGYVYAIAWGGVAGWAGTPSCSGGTILGWVNKAVNISDTVSGCGLFIVQASSGTVTLTATGSWPYKGFATVIRVTT